MKTILYTILLFKLVHSSCHLRSVQTCLQDEQCQLVKQECYSRPSRCQDIDATNPNNCQGIQCYYDFELKICQPNEDEQEDMESRRILDRNDGRDQNNGGSQDQHQGDQEQHQDHNQQQNGENPNQPQDMPTYNVTTNDNQSNPPETETNSTNISNSTEAADPSTNSTSTEILTFEMAQFTFHQDEILNSNLDQKNLVINTSSSIALLATVLLAKLFI